MSELLRLICRLGERENRRAHLHALAETVGASSALVLFRDVELDILLPMPGTPMLASGPGWTELFECCRVPQKGTGTGPRSRLRSCALPLAEDGSLLPTSILVADNGTALVLINGRTDEHLDASLEEPLASALDLLGMCLREEQRSTVSRAREKVAHATATISNALTVALDRSRDELRASWAETARLNRLLEETSHRKDRFLAMLSHELRNPVWALTAALQAMRAGGPETDGEKLVRQIDTATRHADQIARLLDDLLDITRITQDKFELRRTHVDLRDLILHVGRIFGAHARPKGVNFVLSTPTRPIWIVGDAARLEQVLSNLLANAVKYTDAGGRIFLETSSEEDGRVSIIVRDSGIGIAPHVLPNVFDLFVQADQARERSRGGLGIGLTLVRQLVELHGGEVVAHSRGEGHGTEMRVVLPTIPASEVIPDRRRSSPMSLARAARRVLIVDDNRDAADMLCEIVQSWGHVTRAAYEGTAALREAENFRPDIALLDVGLPDISGYALAARLRQSSAARAVLIAVTGYGAASDREKSSEAGFDHHLVKPPNLEHIRFLLEAG